MMLESAANVALSNGHRLGVLFALLFIIAIVLFVLWGSLR